MIIKPNFPNGHATFCDDVRQEIGGKITIVGVYGGELTAYGEAPIALPQLHVVVAFRNAPKDEPYNLKIVVTMNGTAGEDKVLSSSDIEIPAPEQDLIPPPIDEHSMRFMELSNIVRLSPLFITEPCTITVRAYLGDDEVRLGALRVKLAASDEYKIHLPPTPA
jgi:hypothetical protein